MTRFWVSRLLPVSLHRHPLLGALLLGAACGGNAASRDGGGLAGSSGDAGATGGTPAGGSSGLGGASPGGAGHSPACHELDPEPNDQRSVPILRETLSDCDDESTTATGTLAGDDVDWWEFSVDDSFGCVVNPTVSSEHIVRLCVSAVCSNGSFWCEQGIPDDVGGCCQLTPGTAELGVECEGTDDSLTVWVSVWQDWTIPISDRDCLDYSVDVHF
jgi:hypothetical protein